MTEPGGVEAPTAVVLWTLTDVIEAAWAGAPDREQAWTYLQSIQRVRSEIEGATERRRQDLFNELISLPIAPLPLPPDGHGDLTGELVDMTAVDRVSREPLPPEEQTRRTLMIVSAIALVLVVAVNIGCALALDPVDYALVGALLGFLQATAAAVLGGATTYYFTKK